MPAPLLMTSKVKAITTGAVSAALGFIAWLCTAPPEVQSGMLGLFVDAVPVTWRPAVGLTTRLLSAISGAYAMYHAAHSGPAKAQLIAAMLLPAFLFSGCAGFTPGTTTTTPAHTGSGVKIGSDLVSLYAQAIQDYADYKAGNIDVAWTLANVASAYKSITQTVDDAKQLVQDATGKTAGADTLRSRIAGIFASSDASGPANAAAIATAAQAVAANSGP